MLILMLEFQLEFRDLACGQWMCWSYYFMDPGSSMFAISMAYLFPYLLHIYARLAELCSLPQWDRNILQMFLHLITIMLNIICAVFRRNSIFTTCSLILCSTACSLILLGQGQKGLAILPHTPAKKNVSFNFGFCLQPQFKATTLSVYESTL